MWITLLFASVFTLQPASREEAIALARKTLGNEIGVPESEIKVGAVTATDWPDAGLGCPAPGRMYASVITPGFRVELEFSGETYDVHVGAGRAVVCGRALEKVLVELARSDLAGRLHVAVERIRGEKARPATWPDTSLGCPEPGKNYTKGPVRGFVIDLTVDGKTFVYHTDREKVVFCEK